MSERPVLANQLSGRHPNDEVATERLHLLIVRAETYAMTRYRVYLSDAAEFVQQSLIMESSSDEEAIEQARTLIKNDGRVDLWGSPGMTGPLIGSLQLNPGPLSFALVKRIHPVPPPPASGQRPAAASPQPMRRPEDHSLALGT